MILGHYEYDPGQRAIGGGAMGNVYTATDIATGEQVALKILHPHLAEDDEAIHRLQREARLASRIQHPNIARTLEQSQTGEIYWIAMELVPGRSLRRWMKDERRLDAQSQGRGTEAEACAVGLAVSAALAAAHAENVVHRDVKPGNILLPHGFEFQPDAIKLGDFGAARAGDSTFVTRNYSFVGTPEYAAPEAFEGKPVAASDQYSLGATLYELLAGRAPFSGEFDELRHQHRTKQPDFRPIRKAAPSLAPIIERMLEKNARDRYPSAEALHAAIAAIENPLDELALSLDFPSQHEGIAAVTASTISTVWHLPAQWRLASASFAIAALVAGTSAWVAMNANADDHDDAQVRATATARSHGTVLAATAIPPIGSIPAETPGSGDETPNGEGPGGGDNGGVTGGGSSPGGESRPGGQGSGGGSGGTSPATNTPASGSGGGAPPPPPGTPVPTSTKPSGGGVVPPPPLAVPTNTPPPTATFTRTTTPPTPTKTTITLAFPTGDDWTSPSGTRSVCLRTSPDRPNPCPAEAGVYGYNGDAWNASLISSDWDYPHSSIAPKWIWIGGVDGQSGPANGVTHCFSKTQYVDGLRKGGKVWYVADDRITVQVNGNVVVSNQKKGTNALTSAIIDLSYITSNANNTIEACVTNDSVGSCSDDKYYCNPAGFALMAAIYYDEQ